MNAGLINCKSTVDYLLYGITPSIHTYQVWKKKGYTVKKGEKASAKVLIWKNIPAKEKSTEGKEEEKDTDSFLMKTASFFTASQVEKIEK